MAPAPTAAPFSRNERRSVSRPDCSASSMIFSFRSSGVRRVAPLAVVTDPKMRPAPGRHNSAVLPPDRTGRSDGEPPAVDGQRGAVDVVGVLARQTAAAASSSGAGDLHSPCASEMDDVPVGSRRNHQRDVRTDRAAEHQTRPAVEAMGADGPDRAARPTAARRVGELAGEEFLQETGQRVSVQPPRGATGTANSRSQQPRFLSTGPLTGL